MAGAVGQQGVAFCIKVQLQACVAATLCGTLQPGTELRTWGARTRHSAYPYALPTHHAWGCRLVCKLAGLQLFLPTERQAWPVCTAEMAGEQGAVLAAPRWHGLRCCSAVLPPQPILF